MAERSPEPWLRDMLDAIVLIRLELAASSLAELAESRRSRWLIERAFEIVSEASRRLPEAMKARHKHVPWAKVAAIGNILRHEYAHVSAEILWKTSHADLPDLELVCREELARLG